MRHLLKITNIRKWLIEEVEKVLFNVHGDRRGVAMNVNKGSCLTRIFVEIFEIKGVIVLKFCDFLPTRIAGTELLTLVSMYEKQVVNVSNHIS
jgi:hypothetical protein